MTREGTGGQATEKKPCLRDRGALRGHTTPGGASGCGRVVPGGVSRCGRYVPGGASSLGLRLRLRRAAGRPPSRDRRRTHVAVADVRLLPGTAGDKRRATLRHRAASLTEVAGPAPFEQHGRRAGEGAR
ncbi:DUF6380 family protein [Streptomyces sp. NPDC019990]|uniref:DUF6380 family protein n=1 Tax=Streptomyces sp. NPDC019990 TaxID=3154693 RepID=UPI0033C29A5E